MFTEVNAALLASLLYCDSEILDTCLSTTSMQREGKADQQWQTACKEEQLLFKCVTLSQKNLTRVPATLTKQRSLH